MLEAWEDRAVLGDSQKARLNAGTTKSPSWQPCHVSVKNVSAQRYMGEGTRKVVLKYETRLSTKALCRPIRILVDGREARFTGNMSTYQN